MYNAAIDRSALVDIRSVEIDKDLTQTERFWEYIRQIKNPYCYKCDKVIVNISFIDTEETLEDRLESYLSLL